MPPSGDVAVVIPAKNESDHIRETVAGASRLPGVDLVVVVDDGSTDGTARLAGDAGASPRTIARLFRSELGTTFVRWREQVLLARAVPLAARRMPMAAIAAELGYASPSAFAAMVKRSGSRHRPSTRPTRAASRALPSPTCSR